MLLIEDDKLDRMAIEAELASDMAPPVDLIVVDCFDAACQLLTERACDLVLADLHLADSSGLSTLERIHAAAPCLPVILLTGARDEEFAVEALRRGAQDILIKDRFAENRLSRTIRHAMERQDFIRELACSARALTESEARLKAVVHSTGDAMVIVNAEGRVSFANPAAALMFGCTETQFVGKHFGVPVVTGQSTEVDILLPNGRTGCAEMRVTEIDWEGSRALLACLRDVTEQRQMEQQLRRAQKMDAIGQLAGGIAHDFNNILTIINAQSELALDTLHQLDPLRQPLTTIHEAGIRAARLTRQLLTFSRGEVVSPEILDVNEVIGSAFDMLSRAVDESIELTFSPASGLGTVKADRAHIEQIVLNLTVNGRDAMPDGGKITIETAMIRLDESYTRSHVTLLPGEYVQIAVTDTGHGMDEKTRARIFEPFFTTKGPDKGTGLGLATVFGIVQRYGGSIEVYSELSVGTCFKIYLPRIAGKPESVPAKSEDRKWTGRETILLVEDNPEIRKLTGMVLRGGGYIVLEAGDGEEALEVVEKHRSSIHLLVTDAVMPRMGGRKLAELMQKRDPELSVLYVSGYAEDGIVRHGIVQKNAGFLQKPYSIKVFQHKVRELLDQ
ncbi:MAG TPA: response regulator [Acidobacteriaceae bacterium]|nr:response regulator [Acidobacteriaceae bacterium]